MKYSCFQKEIKRIAKLLLIAMFLLMLTACANRDTDSASSYIAGENLSGAPKLILNGKELDVYTSHYFTNEEYVNIPLTAFLSSIGAEYADSPFNEYGITCYSFMDNRYIVNGDMHLFMLEDDYEAFLKELDDAGKELSKETAADSGLFPRNKVEPIRNKNGKVIKTAGIWVNHNMMMNVLRENGIDITIEWDSSNRIITVTLAE